MRVEGVSRVAAIDCGTNSIRLLVGDIADGTLTDVTRQMRIVRLGRDVDRTGRLAPEAIERTRAALAEYVDEMRGLGAERVRMVATSATRDAANADEFRAMVTATLGVPPEVVTGEEEARLSFTGAVRGLPRQVDQPYLVVDIGGGSTEFVLGTDTETGTDTDTRTGTDTDAGTGTDGGFGGTVGAAVSVDIGCVRMTERYLTSDPPTAAEVTAAEAAIGAAVDTALATVPGRDARTLIGLAGSVTTVAALALALPAYDPARIHHARIPYAAVAKVTADLLAMPVAARLALPVMHPGRADVIAAGALILRVLMERVAADSVVVSEHDILDGIAWSLA